MTPHSQSELLAEKLRPNDVYDDLVKRLFGIMLHTADENHIVFARRGKSARDDALKFAISKAKSDFEKKWGAKRDRPTSIRSAHPSESVGLQVVDYYVWALQRLFELGEGRFVLPLAGDYALVMDLDDRRRRAYGEWYGTANPLTLQKTKPAAG